MALMRKLSARPLMAIPYALIADQRLLWVMMLVTLVFTGGGVVSLDAVVSRWFRRSADA